MSFCGSWGYKTVTFSLEWRLLHQLVNLFHFLGIYLSVSYLFAFSYCSWDSQGKNTEVVCHSLLLWTMFCQNSPPWPICLGWPTQHGPQFHWVRQGYGPCDQFDFCDCCLHSVFPLRDKDKSLTEASWWERLTVGENGSCSDGWGHAQ